MRLLNTSTLQLELFTSEDKPAYAALSHTWGAEEVLFDDVYHRNTPLNFCHKQGLAKVLKSAEIARNDGYRYIWIDTCCIDKSSSAELSEAINSMFNWYRKAHVCYAFLEDYTHRGKASRLVSRWFTRGWTLQELIAPLDVQFYDSSWTCFGDRQSLSAEIARLTKIDERVLQFAISQSPICNLKNEHQDIRRLTNACDVCRRYALPSSVRLIRSCSTSTKMSWAANRKTTRVEDIAYCMMGIFDVNMPLLYGEGSKAFRRLQEEIVRRSRDQTIFAWIIARKYSGLPIDSPSSLFASRPLFFEEGSSYHPVHASIEGEPNMAVSSAGVEIDVHLVNCEIDASSAPPEFRIFEIWLAVLNCTYAGDLFASPALVLEKSTYASNAFILRRFYSIEPHCQCVIIRQGQDLCHLDPPSAFRKYSFTSLPFDQYLLSMSILGSIGIQLVSLTRQNLADKVVITFDPARFEKRRVLLLEKTSHTQKIEAPRARFSFHGSRSHSIGRSAPAQNASGVPISHVTLPVWAESEINRATLVYGAVGVLLGEKDGFIILWGICCPEDDAYQLAKKDRNGWRSDAASPFCEVYRPRGLNLLRDTLSEDHLWIENVTDAARYRWLTERPLTTSAPDLRLSGASSLDPDKATTCEKLWASRDGGPPIQVLVNMALVEFLGRFMFQIDVTID